MPRKHLEVLLSALTHPASTSQRMVLVRAIANRADAVQAETTLLKLFGQPSHSTQ
jgi:hypothetical protein